MIQMTHVFKTYPNQIPALSDISLEIADGEFVFIVGHGGSGKTTLLRIVSGAEKVTDGDVIVNGMEITRKGFQRIDRLRRTMGIVFQHFRLLRDRTVHENVAFALEVTGHAVRESRRRASELLEQMGLSNRESAPILALSASEQQRVAVARALVNDPPLLIADEPMGNLDERGSREIMQIFSDFHRKGRTVVLATYDTAFARTCPTYRVIPLRDGRIGEAAS
jgi:cell division transport system ATP-binding protein